MKKNEKTVILKDTKMLTDNVLAAIKDKKLILVEEISEGSEVIYVLENPEGIRVLIPKENCEILTNKKEK